MAATVSIAFDVGELLAFAARARVLPIVAYEAASKVVAETTDDVTRTAQDLAPKLTGMLAASIHGEASGLSGTVSADIRYAEYVEYGTCKDTPQPFMQPAADAHDGQFGIAMEIAVAAAVEAAL